MDAPVLTMMQQTAESASALEQIRGPVPEVVTVVQSDGTLAVTAHGALSPADRAPATTAAAATRVQESHRDLSARAADAVRSEIRRIIRAAERGEAVKVEPLPKAWLPVFTAGTLVRMYVLARSVRAETLNANGLCDRYESNLIPEPDLRDSRFGEPTGSRRSSSLENESATDAISAACDGKTAHEFVKGTPWIRSMNVPL